MMINSQSQALCQTHEIGTPYCLTIDKETLEDNQITIRDRDTAKQERIPIEDAIKIVQGRLNAIL